MKTNLDITELLDHFRADQDVMPSTRKQYYNVIRMFFSWCYHNDIAWQHVGIAHIIRYKDQLYEGGKTTRTIRFYLIVIKIFWKWLANNGIDKDIAESIRLPRRSVTYSKKPLTAEQMKLFLQTIDRSNQIGLRNYALFVLLFTTGLRSLSVESLNIADIKDYHGEKVLWYQNKGYRQKDEFKPLTDKCLEAINDYLLTRNNLKESSPLFATHAINRSGYRLTRQTMRLIFRKHLKRNGIEDKRISLHSTRHTFAVLTLKSSGIYEAQIGLNHKSADTTRIYIHNADENIILENKAGKAIDNMI